MPGWNEEKLKRAARAKDAFVALYRDEKWFGGCGVSCFGEDAKIELRVKMEHFDSFIHLYEFDGIPVNVVVVGDVNPY